LVDFAFSVAQAFYFSQLKLDVLWRAKVPKHLLSPWRERIKGSSHGSWLLGQQL